MKKDIDMLHQIQNNLEEIKSALKNTPKWSDISEETYCSRCGWSSKSEYGPAKKKTILKNDEILEVCPKFRSQHLGKIIHRRTIME